MSQDRTQTPVVIVMASGEVLVSGSGVAAVLAAVRLAVRMNRVDGIAPSAGLRAVEGAFTEAKARQVVLAHLAPELVGTSGTSTGASEYRAGPSLAESPTRDPMTVREAALMMTISERAVRALCARQTLASRRVRGKWLVDRAAVLGRIEQREAS